MSCNFICPCHRIRKLWNSMPNCLLSILFYIVASIKQAELRCGKKQKFFFQNILLRIFAARRRCDADCTCSLFSDHSPQMTGPWRVLLSIPGQILPVIHPGCQSQVSPTPSSWPSSLGNTVYMDMDGVSTLRNRLFTWSLSDCMHSMYANNTVYMYILYSVEHGPYN